MVNYRDLVVDREYSLNNTPLGYFIKRNNNQLTFSDKPSTVNYWENEPVVATENDEFVEVEEPTTDVEYSDIDESDNTDMEGGKRRRQKQKTRKIRKTRLSKKARVSKKKKYRHMKKKNKKTIKRKQIRSKNK